MPVSLSCLILFKLVCSSNNFNGSFTTGAQSHILGTPFVPSTFRWPHWQLSSRNLLFCTYATMDPRQALSLLPLPGSLADWLPTCQPWRWKEPDRGSSVNECSMGWNGAVYLNVLKLEQFITLTSCLFAQFHSGSSLQWIFQISINYLFSIFVCQSIFWTQIVWRILKSELSYTLRISRICFHLPSRFSHFKDICNDLFSLVFTLLPNSFHWVWAELIDSL